MMNQNQHTTHEAGWRFIRNVLVKAIALFILLNLVVVFLPTRIRGDFSLYNLVFPGRERLPFGENPREAYNLSLYDFHAMFASHKIDDDARDEDEFRIVTIGDSSVWGTLLKPEETLAGQIDVASLTTCDGKPVRVYNLGYPTLSLFKDLALLDQSLEYEPDLILWLMTLESFSIENQLSTPIIANNPDLAVNLIDRYGLSFERQNPALMTESFWDKTIPGRRRDLADLLRIQAYGVMWAATGVDQVYPVDYPPAQRDLEEDYSFHRLTPEGELEEQLAFDLLDAGVQAANGVPVWFINEPMMISDGENSDVRYNFFYPRWAYDQYRQIMADKMTKMGWVYLDLWDLVEQTEFTNSAIHLTPVGSKQLADRLILELRERYCIQ